MDLNIFYEPGTPQNFLHTKENIYGIIPLVRLLLTYLDNRRMLSFDKIKRKPLLVLKKLRLNVFSRLSSLKFAFDLLKHFIVGQKKVALKQET